VTRFLAEQQNDTAAAVSMLGTHEHIVQSWRSVNTSDVTVKEGANCLTIGPLPCRCISLSGSVVYDAAVFKRH